ncbi:hypothetical protein FRB94_002164 [Tulasnella sp. JGI-2019a]|nr:hypothetical protein FRB94_002164 [Tulasnella sp. JGI-2019a]
MFGPFKGPIPQGWYRICIGDLALQVTNPLNNTVPAMNPTSRSEYEKWYFEYGQTGYRIKVNKSQYLCYTPWAIPSKMIGQHDHIVAHSSHPVEWRLVQTSAGPAKRTFQLRVTAGNDFQPADVILVGWIGGKIYPVTGDSGANFTLRAIMSEYQIPKSLTVEDNTKCLIRSVYVPHIALQLHRYNKNPVVGRTVTDDNDQVWTFHKGNVGFKMTISNYHIYTSDVYWSPDKSPSLLTAQAIYASEFTIVPEGQGFQLRLASDPTLVVTLWDLDPSDDCWIHLSKLPADGNADANQLWIFTKPEGEVN